MRRIEESIFVGRPCDQVFAYLEDRSTIPRGWCRCWSRTGSTPADRRPRTALVVGAGW
jgi:hypothetical protein